MASIGTRRSGLALASAWKVCEKDHILSPQLGEVGGRNHCVIAGMCEEKYPWGKTQGERCFWVGNAAMMLGSEMRGRGR